MVIADVTVATLGHFLIHDNWTTEEVLLLPSVDEEMEFLNIKLLDVASPFNNVKDTLLAALAYLYGLNFDPELVTFHKVVELPLEPEPET